MRFRTSLFGNEYTFSNIVELLAKANEEKSGDKLAGIAAKSAEERIAAKAILAKVPLHYLRENPVVPYAEDEVTRIIQDDVNEKIYAEIKDWTVEMLREFILDDQTSGEEVKRISRGLTAEMIAAVTKLMSTLDLIVGAKKIKIVTTCNTTVGEEGVLAYRLQPNHTTDDPDGITASLFEGLSYGMGDALIGLNPVDDSVESVITNLKRFDEIKRKFNIPTQICVLAHVSTQVEAIKRGAPTDLIFQSIAGSEKGNAAFGFNAADIQEAYELALKHGTARGENVMYFETGQGSELSADAHYGADQLTMEARCYGFAKRFKPFLVNTVVGFIGPEYLYDSKQVIRAGLEDHFMAKLTGIPMGCDACYTNHMKTDQNDIENLMILLAAAGCTYFMAIPHGDDIMLNYQTTGFHDDAAVRSIMNKRPVKEFEAWCEQMGIMKDGKLTSIAGDASIFME